MKSQTNSLPEYLASNAVIDWQGTIVEQKSHDLCQGLLDEGEKAHCLFNWVRDEIPHSNDINSELVTCSATEVLNSGTGICFAKSHLLAGLLRAQNIAAGFCYQAFAQDPPDTGMSLHGLNAIFLTALQEWIRVDARGNTGDRDAHFNVDEESLAYAVDAQRGEFIYPTIYAQPVAVIIKAFAQSDNREQLGANLPQAW